MFPSLQLTAASRHRPMLSLALGIWRFRIPSTLPLHRGVYSRFPHGRVSHPPPSLTFSSRIPPWCRASPRKAWLCAAHRPHLVYSTVSKQVQKVSTSQHYPSSLPSPTLTTRMASIAYTPYETTSNNVGRDYIDNRRTTVNNVMYQDIVGHSKKPIDRKYKFCC